MRKTKNGKILTVVIIGVKKSIKKRKKSTKKYQPIDFETKTINKENQKTYNDDKFRFGKLFHDFMSQIVAESDYKKAELKMKPEMILVKI